MLEAAVLLEMVGLAPGPPPGPRFPAAGWRAGQHVPPALLICAVVM